MNNTTAVTHERQIAIQPFGSRPIGIEKCCSAV